MRYVTDLSLFWLLPWGVISGFLAYWLYSSSTWFQELNKKWQIMLRVLRASGLFLLGVLLFGMLFEVVNYRIEKPIIIALVDGSTSMKNYKDSADVSTLVNNLQRDMKEKLSADFEIVEMNVGKSANYGAFKGFNASSSNLALGIEKIQSDYYSRNVGAVVFVSDGNYNGGNNPVYAAEKLNFTPVFSLAVGDTTPKRDHFIKNVAANEVVYLKNKFPVEIDIEAVKIGKIGAKVSILSNGKVVASQPVQYKNGKKDFVQVSFLLEATKLGFQSYTVAINDVENEFNYTNNKQQFYVEVVDARNKVLVLASAPHPDIAALKHVLEENDNIEVESAWLKDWNKDLSKIDMVIWHEPGLSNDVALNELLIAKNIPVFYVIGPQTPSAFLPKLKIGVSLRGGNQTDDVQGVCNASFHPFDIRPETQEAIRYFPPLKSKFGELSFSSGAEVLVQQRTGGVTKKDPLLFFNTRGTAKYGVLFGEGAWKWKMNDFVRNGSFEAFSELFEKSFSYLVVKQDASALRVNFPKRLTKDQNILVNASFYNELMTKITTPKIKLEVIDNTGKKSNYQFAVTGDFYKLDLGKWRPGKYKWYAKTKFNGKNYSKNGEFIVEDVSIENLDTYANHALLKQLSAKNGGSFAYLKQYQSTLDKIQNSQSISSVSYRDASFNELIDFKFILALLILLFAVEWFLRRWLGSY
jgi:hypothetical protein